MLQIRLLLHRLHLMLVAMCLHLAGQGLLLLQVQMLVIQVSLTMSFTLSMPFAFQTHIDSLDDSIDQAPMLLFCYAAYAPCVSADVIAALTRKKQGTWKFNGSKRSRYL